MKDRYPLTRPDVKVLLAKGGEDYSYSFDFLCRSEDGVFSRRVEKIYGARIIIFPGYFGRGLINYILDCWRYFEFMARIIFGAYRAILVRDEYFSAFLGCLSSVFARKPFLYWMSFPMYEQYRDAAKNSKGLKRCVLNIKSKLTELIVFGFVLRISHHVFCQSDAMKSVLVRKGIDHRKITPVPMGVDFSVIDKVVADDRMVLNPQGVNHLCCLTIHSSVRQLDVLLEAASFLKKRGIMFKLWMVGGEDIPGEINRLRCVANKFCLGESVEFVGLLDQFDAFRLARGCVLGVSVIPHGPLFDVSSPTKLVEYVALGIPVVGSDIPDQEHIINSSNFGCVVMFDPVSISNGIEYVLDNIDSYLANSSSAFAYVKKNRDYLVLTDLVFSTINSVLGE